MTAQITLTAKQSAQITLAMKNAKERIEFEQREPIDLDLACIIYDFCEMINIEPRAVLGEAIALVNDLVIINPE
jgi:hypothetical protein